MVEAADGKVYVTETGGALQDVDLTAKTMKPVLEGLAGPEGVDIGPDGQGLMSRRPAPGA